jgi:hypothetical protein
MVLVSALFLLIRSLILPRTALAAENLALRQQLAILNRKIHRPQLHRRDRFFWAPLSILEELAGGLDHRQTGDRHQMAQARLQALLAMEVQDAGRPSEDR